jgi:hypothetical protein
MHGETRANRPERTGIAETDHSKLSSQRNNSSFLFLIATSMGLLREMLAS